MLSFLAVSLVMSLLALAFFALSSLLPNKLPQYSHFSPFSPTLRYFVWVVIFVGLAIPIRPTLGNAPVNVRIPLLAPALSATNQQMPPVPSAAHADLPYFPATTLTDSIAIGNTLNINQILLIIWLAVAAVIFTYHMWKYIRFSRIVNRWSEPVTDKNTLEILRNLLYQSYKNKIPKIKVKKCEFVSTSMLVGFFRPVILLPYKDFDSDELEFIFRHELIHYRRGDLYIKLLSVIVVALHWFNPIIYLLSSAMQADCEASCDEAVLANFANDGYETRQFYAELIMEMIGDKRQKSTVLSTCFYGGKRGIKIRMDAIMNDATNFNTAKKLTFSSLLMLILCVTLLSGSVLAFSDLSDLSDFDDISGISYFADISELSSNYDSAGLQEQSQQSQQSETISAVQARDIALSTVGGGTMAGLFHDSHLDIFRIEIIYNATRYYLAIDTNTGDVLIYQHEEILENTVTWAQALEIALTHTNGGAIVSGAMEVINEQTIFMFTISNLNQNYDVMIGGGGELLMIELVQN